MSSFYIFYMKSSIMMIHHGRLYGTKRLVLSFQDDEKKGEVRGKMSEKVTFT